jgi:hypothetical protein
MATMKFRAHDTFFIRKGWLSKGMERIVAKPDLFVDKDENPMDVLGIGSNMVKALRYWMQAVGLTKEETKGKRVQRLTEFGEIVYAKDTYIEELGTLYFLQYKLAKQKENATAWYYFFNEFNMSEFTKEEFVQSIQNYIHMQEDELTVAIRSLNDDFSCIINTYLPRYKSSPEKVTPENNIDCPFGELGLIDIANKKKKTYKKTIPAAKSLSPWVVLAVIMDNAEGRTEISLNELLTAPCNIGKTYNLDAITMLDILHEIENIGQIKIVRTAGLDVIHLNSTYSFHECVTKYYESIDEEM